MFSGGTKWEQWQEIGQLLYPHFCWDSRHELGQKYDYVCPEYQIFRNKTQIN